MCWLVIIGRDVFFQPTTYCEPEMPVFRFAVTGRDGPGSILRDHFDMMWKSSATDSFRSSARAARAYSIISDMVKRHGSWLDHIHRNLKPQERAGGGVWEALPGCGPGNRQHLRHNTGSMRRADSVTVRLEHEGGKQAVTGRLLDFSRSSLGILLEGGEIPPSPSDLPRNWILKSMDPQCPEELKRDMRKELEVIRGVEGRRFKLQKLYWGEQVLDEAPKTPSDPCDQGLVLGLEEIPSAATD